MKSKRRIIRMIILVNVMIICSIFFYKGYLSVKEKDVEDMNNANISSIKKSQYDNEISFVVLGNIKNSINIFDRNMVKKINNDEDIQFVVSTGNSVRDGREDKYKILNRSLNKLEVPTVVGVGDNEITEGGYSQFYKQYGDLYFSFEVSDSYFIFLDTTGFTPTGRQKNWLETELNNAKDYAHIFVFMNRPPFKVSDHTILHLEDKYIKSSDEREYLTNIFREHDVTAVFSSGSVKYLEKEIKGVPYYISGGAGGELIINDDDSFYHYMKVVIADDQVGIDYVKQEIPSNHFIYRIFQNIWVYIHSLFYTSAINIILILSIILTICLYLYNFITKEVDYYRDFSDLEDEEILKDKKLNIAMFTNNYFPFIGGVPISIKRLAEGLMKKGHNVYIFAPEYPNNRNHKNEGHVIRCKLLLYYKGREFDFAIANVFRPTIEKEFLNHHFDVIHVHHPFWMGKKGLKLGRRYELPVILTYHTRLEKYAHYLPLFQTTFQNLFSHHMIKKFSQACDAIIAPTTTAKEYLQNIGVSKEKYVLPTGIGLEQYKKVTDQDINQIKQHYKSSDDEILLCSVSRLSKEKNIYFLLEGIKYIKQQTDVPFKLLLIGDGPERNQLQSVIKQQGLDKVVHLIGSISPNEVIKFYLACDLFVFSSQSETQGMVILEAMAGGCPVVAIRSSGIDDVIVQNCNGYKTKPEVSVWANKVISLLEDQDKLRNMSKEATKFSNKFGVEEMATHVEDIYYKKIQQNKAYLENLEENHEE